MGTPTFQSYRMIVTDFFRILRSITKRKNSFYRDFPFDILPIMMILKVLIVFEILIFGHLLLAQQTIKKSESDLEKKVAEEVKKNKRTFWNVGSVPF